MLGISHNLTVANGAMGHVNNRHNWLGIVMSSVVMMTWRCQELIFVVVIVGVDTSSAVLPLLATHLLPLLHKFAVQSRILELLQVLIIVCLPISMVSRVVSRESRHVQGLISRIVMSSCVLVSQVLFVLGF